MVWTGTLSFCLGVAVTKTDIAGFWKVFRTYDDDRKGVITLKDFFDKIIHENRNILGNAIFELVGKLLRFSWTSWPEEPIL